jgi:sec-independent protein translocase protein TatC
MPFGEHIEELRKHLVRALLGVLAAFLFTIFFATRVVTAITEPVESAQREWYVERYNERAKLAADLVDKSASRTAPIKVRLTESQVRVAAGLLGLAPAAKAPAGNGAPVNSPPATAPAPGDGTSAAEKVAEEPSVLVATEIELGPLVQSLALPLAEVSQPWRLKSLASQEAFMVYFKAMFGAAIVIASPWVFYQIYSFVAVGLYSHERRFVRMTLPFCVILFLAGVGLCYFFVFRAMVTFFLGANQWMDIEPNTSLSEWVGFAVIMMLIFGIMFQLPLLMLILERVGIISYELIAGQRKVAILVNLIVAAVVTPTQDPTTLLLLAVPMCLLFELGLFLMRYFQRKNPFAADEPEEDLELIKV